MSAGSSHTVAYDVGGLGLIALSFVGYMPTFAATVAALAAATHYSIQIYDRLHKGPRS